MLVLRLLTGLTTCFSSPKFVDGTPVDKQLTCGFHRHAAEVGNKMSTVGVASNITLRAFPRVLSAKRKHVAAVTAPIRADVSEGLETMRDAMIDLLLVSILQGKLDSCMERRESDLPQS